MFELNEHGYHGSCAGGAEADAFGTVLDVSLRTQIFSESGLHLLVECPLSGPHVVQETVYVNRIFAI